jgi:IS5 family transposase
MRQFTEVNRSILYREIDSLSQKKLGIVLDFIRFMKMKEKIDSDQLYFLTKEWQKKEKLVDVDKKKHSIVGDGTAQGLIRALKK